MKRLILAIATLAFLPPFAGCGSGSNTPVDNTAGSSEAEAYEKRRAEEREKGTRPPVPPPSAAGNAPR
jgi:hypothetical protein